MKKTHTLLLTAIIMSLAGCVQNMDKAKLDAYFDTLVSNDRFMGSVSVFKNNELIYAKSVGFADVEQGTKAIEDSKYRIGSISKTFTAALVFMAIEENRLNLNQTIDLFFPVIKNAEKITVALLLQHRSGIHNFTNDSSYISWNTQPKTEQEMVELIAKAGSDFEPDAKTSYSNSNFVLLSYMLEKIYQKPYSEILEEKIIKPAGLKNTYYGGKIDVKNNESNSYRYDTDDWKKEPETDMSIPMGAGGVVSTPTDLNFFANALFNGKLLNKNSLAQMTTMKEGMGMGLFQMPFYDKAGFGHTGGIDGFSSVFAYFPDDNISFAYTSNGINYNGNDIAIVVLNAIFGKPFEISEFTSIVYKVTDNELDIYLGVYANQQLPLKMTITKVSGKLVGQATGQPAFPLEATAKDKFQFLQAGIILEFNPADKTMVLKQGGGTFLFTKETN